MESTLLEEIEIFVRRWNLAESTFGREALGDWRFIADLRGRNGKRPRRVWPETASKVRHFMLTYRPSHEREAA